MSSTNLDDWWTQASVYFAVCFPAACLLSAVLSHPHVQCFPLTCNRQAVVLFSVHLYSCSYTIAATATPPPPTFNHMVHPYSKTNTMSCTHLFWIQVLQQFFCSHTVLDAVGIHSKLCDCSSVFMELALAAVMGANEMIWSCKGQECISGVTVAFMHAFEYNDSVTVCSSTLHGTGRSNFSF